MKLTLRILFMSVYVFLAVVFAPVAIIIVILISIPHFWARLRKHRPEKSIPAPAVPFPGPVKTPAETRAKFVADDWNHAAYYDLRREGHC